MAKLHTVTKTKTNTAITVALAFLGVAVLAAVITPRINLTQPPRLQNQPPRVLPFSSSALQIQRLQLKKRAALDDIDVYINLIDNVKTKSSTVVLPSECSSLDILRSQFVQFKDKIDKSQESHLHSVLHEYEHAIDDTSLALCNAKIVLPEKIDAFVNQVAEIKNGHNMPQSDAQNIDHFIQALNQVYVPFKAMASKDKMSDGALSLSKFFVDHKKELTTVKSNVRKLFNEKNIAAESLEKHFDQLLGQIQVESEILVDGRNSGAVELNAIHRHSDKSTNALFSGNFVSSSRVIVLFIHWLHDPLVNQLSNRAEIDSELVSAESFFREISYNKFDPHFDVCEMTADVERPATRAEVVRTALDLCDPVVDYNQYDWLISYPGRLGRGEAANAFIGPSRPRFSTEDGIVHLGDIMIGGSPFSSFLILHEGGHVLGLQHAHSVDCGEHVFGAGCITYDDYGDYFDVMSHGHDGGHYNAAYKEQLGWLNPLTPDLRASSSVVISAIEKNDSSLHAIKLPVDPFFVTGNFSDYRVDNPCRELFIEYRKPIGLDINLPELYIDGASEGGLLLQCATTEPPAIHHRSDGSAFLGSGTHAWLLDATPASELGGLDFYDALLFPGMIVDTHLGYTIQFNEALSGDQARISIFSSYPNCEATSDFGARLVRPDGGIQETFSPTCASTTSVNRYRCTAASDRAVVPVTTVTVTCVTGSICVDADGSGPLPAHCARHCEDSDFGNDPEIGGTTREFNADGSISSFDQDSCQSRTHLIEYFCDTSGREHSVDAFCPSGEICIPPATSDSSESAHCGPSTTVPIPDSGSTPVLIPPSIPSPSLTCTENDGGNNPAVAGTAILKDHENIIETHADSCDTGTILQEYYCSGPTPSASGGGSPVYSILHSSVDCGSGRTCIDPDGSGPQPAHCSS